MGLGTPLCEFMHVDDCAAPIVHICQYYSAAAPINNGSVDETTIRNLEEMICDTSISQQN